MSNIQNMSLEDIMGERFGRYTKYIIQDRALPDIRDGLKPVQRRILYSMNKDGNTFDKSYRKSAKSVGNIMGNFHPHGDSSIYDAMVRMSQDWKNREILVEM
ncbi:MAG: DNA gyrase subunit A, partial [Streptococcus mitis]|nr:DNA gyrase subunit A [Streptococcus mitis]